MRSARAPEARGRGAAARLHRGPGSVGLRGTLIIAGVLAAAWTAPHPAAAQATPAEAPRTPGALTPLPDVDPATVQEVDLSLTVVGDFSPYQAVRYEIRNRGETLLVSLSKELAGSYGELSDVGLRPIGDLPGLLDGLRRCGFDALDPAAAPPSVGASPTLRIEVRIDDFQRVVTWPEAEAPPGSPVWCSAHLFSDLYAAIGDPVPFQNLFWDEGEFGELDTTSTPAAHLFVDGQDTGLETPIFGLRLEPGSHALRYVNDELGIDRHYDVTIVADHTTQLQVELR